jgi:hypothetical protein
MVRKRASLLTVGALCVVALGAWAQAKSVGDQVEDQIRRGAFHYYFGTVLGNAEEYLAGTRLPLYVVRNGVGTYKDEKAARAELAQFAEKLKAVNLSEDDRKQMVSNLIRTLDEASIQFVGANTATLTFLVRHDERAGDQMCTLTLYRPDVKAGTWKVIAELTDSAPIPPSYIK